LAPNCSPRPGNLQQRAKPGAPLQRVKHGAPEVREAPTPTMDAAGLQSIRAIGLHPVLARSSAFHAADSEPVAALVDHPR
jgi:hypothetical protein